MKGFTRSDAPACIADRQVRWTAKWVQRNALGNRFSWPVYQREKLNKVLLPQLQSDNQFHCCYCDAYPVQGVSSDTIDHFKPKSVYPNEAFDWDNLFYCCSACQEAKLERFETGLLKPDVQGLTFDKFFRFNASTGEIEPNPIASPEDFKRAEVSIQLFGLNEKGRPITRRQTFRERYQQFVSGGVSIDDLPYRFIFEP